MKSVENPLVALLRCPACGGALVTDGDGVTCGGCGVGYPLDRSGGLSFIAESMYDSSEEYEFIRDVAEFWGNGWEKRQGEHAHLYEMDRTALLAFAAEEIEGYRARRGRGMLWSTEIEPAMVEGKVGLNIGSGTGVEALLMLSQGARAMLALDATRQARDATQRIIDKVGAGLAVQGDARHLPLADESVDFVYSSGVLHHSPNIERSVREIHRVLKPGGFAFVGLYSKSSISFQKTNLKGVLKGKFTRRSIQEHLSRNTEPAWKTAERDNPHTELFGVADCERLFAMFGDVSARRGQFETPNVPGLRWLKRWENAWLLSHIGMGVYIKAVK